MRRDFRALVIAALIVVVSGSMILIVAFDLRDRADLPARATPSQPGSVVVPNNAALPTVDGKIGANEYAYSYVDSGTSSDSGIGLFWTVDRAAGLIYLALKSPAQPGAQPANGPTGRIWISLAPTGPALQGGDILIGVFMADGTLSTDDEFAKGPTNNVPDTEDRGQNDIARAAGTISANGAMSLELVRALATSDVVHDKPIGDASMNVQIGYGSQPNVVGLYADPSIQLDVNFFTGDVQPSASQ